MNTKQEHSGLVLLGGVSVLALRAPIFPIELLFYVYLAVSFISVLLANLLFDSSRKSVLIYFPLGAFLGACLDVLIYPEVNGFERNLYPLEIANYTIISIIIALFVTGVFYVLDTSIRKSTDNEDV